MKLLCRDEIYPTKKSSGGGGGRGREMGDRSVHLVQRRVDGTWTTRAEKRATKTWMAGSGGENGGCGMGHGSP